ncbi:unnamed protein product, partial [Didymodactylos carnosus]
NDKAWCNRTFGNRSDIIITPNTFTAAEDLAILTV